MPFCRFATYATLIAIFCESAFCRLTFHDEILPRMYAPLNVLTPAPRGSDRTPLLRRQ
jgi:hypothetical protein